MGATLLLIRHGETGIDSREQVPEDPLSDKGRRDVRALAENLAEVPVTAFYASPYRRALETAEILASGQPVETDNRLREIPLWANPKDLSEDQKRFELTKILVEAQEGVNLVLDRALENHPDGVLAFVCHGNIIRAILALTLGMPLDMVVRLETTTASVTALRKNEDGYRLLLFNGKTLGGLEAYFGKPASS